MRTRDTFPAHVYMFQGTKKWIFKYLTNKHILYGSKHLRIWKYLEAWLCIMNKNYEVVLQDLSFLLSARTEESRIAYSNQDARIFLQLLKTAICETSGT